MSFLHTNTPSLQNTPKAAPLKHLQGVKELDLHFSTDISVKIIYIRITFFEVNTNDYRAGKKTWPFF